MHSSTPPTHARKTLHILSTSFLEGDEVLVNFADGSSAIYEVEELEKLRPTAKQVLPAGGAQRPTYADVA